MYRRLSHAGARKWQVHLDFDADAFKNAIYKIYPRLTSVPGYTLWNIKKDKTFEKLPAMVRTMQQANKSKGNIDIDVADMLQ